MRQYGFQNGDVVTEINGKPLENVSDISKYILLRDVSQLTVKDSEGAIRHLSLPDSIGKMLFLRGETSPFTLKNSACYRLGAT